MTEGWTSATFLIVLAGACVAAVALSWVMSWASNRSALWNMLFGGFFVFVVFAGAVLLAYLLTRAAFG
jgi:hypothetical protein